MFSIVEHIRVSQCSSKTLAFSRAMSLTNTEFNLEFTKNTADIKYVTSRREFYIFVRFYWREQSRPEKQQARKLADDSLDLFIKEHNPPGSSFEHSVSGMALTVFKSFGRPLQNLIVDLSTVKNIQNTLALLGNTISKDITIYGASKCNWKALIYILNISTEKNSLTLLSNPGSDFVYKKAFKTDSLRIESAKWFTRSNLLTSNCRIIELKFSNLTNADLNQFLTMWQRGSFKKLEELEIRNIKFLDEESVLYGLDAIRKKTKEMGTFFSILSDKNQRRGADVHLGNDDFCLTVWSETMEDN
ncbi:unnamed protein product [Caenorhabditis sp. 36 PRJEB53466]|nr:unnamed protein product [Caenorhabditis sp. 36 PRJEB53466]